VAVENSRARRLDREGDLLLSKEIKGRIGRTEKLRVQRVLLNLFKFEKFMEVLPAVCRGDTANLHVLIYIFLFCFFV